MAVKAQRVTVLTTATRLDQASSSVSGGDFGQGIAIKNKDAASIYVGDVTVTTSANSFEVAAGEVIAWDMGDTDGVYGISAAGTSANAVHVLQTGV